MTMGKALLLFFGLWPVALAKDCGIRNVDCVVGDGASYGGDVSKTKSGLECQAWNVQAPHHHRFGRLGAHNNCRNPDGEPGPWCYTTSTRRWELCSVRQCTACDKDPLFRNGQCMIDAKTIRVLPNYMGSKSSNTPQSCMELCSLKGYLYAGVEYGSECYCGNEVPSYARLTQDSECHYGCAGDKNQMCGGSGRINVYKTEEISFKKVDGLCVEQPNNKLLPFYVYGVAKHNTPKLCTEVCSLKGYKFAGVKWGKECWCGNDEPPRTSYTSSDQCNYPCTGDKTLTCGAGDTLNLYKTGFSGENLFLKAMKSIVNGGKAPAKRDPVIVKHMGKFINSRNLNLVRSSPQFKEVELPFFIKLLENPELNDIFPDFGSFFQRYHLPHLIQDAAPNSPLLKGSLPTNFPPPVSDTAKIIQKRTVTIMNPVVNKTRCVSCAGSHWISTGLYAKQGQLVTVTVPAYLIKKFGIQVGALSDHIFGKNLYERSKGRKDWRAPIITQYYEEEMIKERTRILTPYGGLIFIEVKDFNTLGTFNLEFENVIDSPRFIYGESNNESWEKSFDSTEAPMVELEVPGIIFTMPKATIKKLKPDMEKLANLWKDLMVAFNDLVGYVVPIPQRYTVDVMISIGSEHAGYPMRCASYWNCDYVFDLSGKTGRGLDSGYAWGVFHEIGHNLQAGIWTPSGLGEVTNNIMAEYVNHRVINFKPHPADPTMTEKFRKGGKKFDELGNSEFLNIFMIVQDKCGWSSFKKFFRFYNEKMPSTLSPDTTENKYSTIAKVLSLSCNKNLVPFFKWWNWPILNDTVEETKSLPAWKNVENMLDSSVKQCSGKGGCCNEEYLCGEGEGRCSENDDCVAGMRCGRKNCDLTTLTFHPNDNCCSASVTCDGGDSCCTEDLPCGVGEGDCDKDSHCKDGLKCGGNNCDQNTGTFDAGDDCCYDPSQP